MLRSPGDAEKRMQSFYSPSLILKIPLKYFAELIPKILNLLLSILKHCLLDIIFPHALRCMLLMILLSNFSFKQCRISELNRSDSE